jgi:hypothetical protein
VEDIVHALLTDADELTPWSRVLLGKPTVAQLLKDFPVLYGRGRFITVLTIARHWSLS